MERQLIRSYVSVRLVYDDGYSETFDYNAEPDKGERLEVAHVEQPGLDGSTTYVTTITRFTPPE
jgi:hypothetical protein